MAINMGVLPWPQGEAAQAATVCFNAWLDQRGYTGASEHHRGIEAVVEFVQRHGSSRFDDWGGKERTVIN
jgi:hypothetical protein